MSDIDILKDDEIAEIEARKPVSYWTFKGDFAGQFVPLTGMDRDALCRSHRTLAAERDKGLEEYKLLLHFFGATVDAEGGLNIDMKAYHAAHICKDHQWLPKERRLIEERCPVCVNERIRTLESACEAARKLFVGLLPELDRAEDVEVMIKRLEGAIKHG